MKKWYLLLVLLGVVLPYGAFLLWLIEKVGVSCGLPLYLFLKEKECVADESHSDN